MVTGTNSSNVNWASAISQSGVIVGRYVASGTTQNGGGFWWDGTMHTIAIAGTAQAATPTCIAGSYVVGSTSSLPLTGGHGFIYTLGASYPSDLWPLSGDTWSIAYGVDNAGTAVGASAATVGGPAVAVIYNSGTPADLNTLIDPSAGWSLTAATAISNDGKYIVGYGTINGWTHGFLLTEASPGDANLDGSVDVNDLTIVLASFGNSGMVWSQGDFNDDGRVDVNDLTILLTSFGQSLGSPAGRIAAVPEPSGLAALAAGSLGLLACAWRRRR